MKTPIQRALVAGGLALTVGGGIVVASAATLGGLTAKNLGADNSLIYACDTNGLNIAYTNTYDPTGQRFVVANAVISGLATACAGQVMNVELTGVAGAALASATPITVTGTSETVTFTSPPAAEDVDGAAIVITG
jgi:hypothetical protein